VVRFIVRRVLQLCIVSFLLSAATFALMKMAPGDPVRAILKPDEFVVTAEAEAELRRSLGLDQPVALQYVRWLGKVVRFDLGVSHVTGRPVAELLLDRLPVTLQLTGGALLVMAAIAFPLGVAAARGSGGFVDHASRLLATLGASIPNFLLGLLLIYAFSFRLGWLPSMGTGTAVHLILPSATLGLAFAAIYARVLRSGLLESLSQDYVRAARARGLSERRIVWRIAMRGALPPVVTLFGMNIGALLGGSVVVEVMFSQPGLGSLAVGSILSRDYPVIQGYVLFTGMGVIAVNAAVDLAYRRIDPRIRLSEEGGPV